MITPELKDRILSDLVNSPINSEVNINTDCDRYGIDSDEYFAILQHFERLNLISMDACLGGEVFIQTHIEAHDLWRTGGFTGQETLLKANIEKLGMEIDKLSRDLSPKQLDTAQKIASIGSSILSVLSLFR